MAGPHTTEEGLGSEAPALQSAITAVAVVVCTRKVVITMRWPAAGAAITVLSPNVVSAANRQSSP